MISAAAMALGEEIQVCDLPEEVQAASEAAAPGDFMLPSPETGLSPSAGLLEHMEKKMILDVFRQANGHHEKAARLLGISSKTLSRKLKSYAEPNLEPCHSALSA